MKLFRLIILGLLFLTACTEDKGNYDYDPINEITVSGIDETYYVVAGVTQLRITPEVTGTKYADDRLEYTWYTCFKDAYFEHHHAPLATGKDLDTEIKLAPGTYDLYLTVRDTETDMEYNFKSALVVSTTMMKGFYLYGDKPDGTVGMDFLSTPSGADTVLIKNIFTNQSGIRGAVDLCFSGNNRVHASLENLWAITTEGTYKIASSIQKSSVFDIDEEYNESAVFFPTIEVKRPLKVLDEFPGQSPSPVNTYTGGSVHYGRGIITEDAIFVGNVSQGFESYGNPVNRYSLQSTELFKPYEKAFYRASSTTAWMVLFYDYTNECFCTLRNSDGALSNATTCMKLADRPTDLFPWNQDGRTLLYGENEPQNGYCYALMKDLNNDNKYYIYRFYVFRTTNIRKQAVYEIDLTAMPDLKQASMIRFFGNQLYILYSVGSKLYAYNFSSKQQPILLKDFGEEITSLDFYYGMDLINGWMPDYAIDLMVGTYSAANGGTVRQFRTTSSTNNFEITQKKGCEWKTDLKVKKSEFRNSGN